MAITVEYDYHKPSTLNEGLKLLKKFKKPRILAGGTDLIVKLKDGAETPDAVIDIKGIPELQKLSYNKNKLLVGACITFTDLIESSPVKDKFPLIREAAKTVASVGIRNRATLVGNICSAVPSLDSAPALLTYEAEVLVRGPNKAKKIPISKFFLGPKKPNLKKGEIVTGISVAMPAKKHAGCYVKLGRYSGEDLAQTGICIMALADKTFRVAYCAVGPVPKRAHNIEKLLSGKEITQTLIKEAKDILEKEIAPITDIRASREYRLHMMKIMFERGLSVAEARLRGESIETHNLLGG